MCALDDPAAGVFARTDQKNTTRQRKIRTLKRERKNTKKTKLFTTEKTKTKFLGTQVN